MFPMQGGQSDEKLYVDDVFSAYLYTGNSSTQTITNGIDLAGKGGMVWLKDRSSGQNHAITDTVRGTGSGKQLQSNTTSAATTDTFSTFTSGGFSLDASLGLGAQNLGTVTYVSWTFRKAPKFFDVVTYTGDGNAGRTVAHSLGQVPGMIIVKAYSGGLAGSRNWPVYHRTLANTETLLLNLTDAKATSAGYWNSTTPTSTQFTVGIANAVNESGTLFVAYLFAHDTSTDGIIQCGSYTGNGSAAGPTVTLGWEPQYVMMKRASGGEGNWTIMDIMRGIPTSGIPARLIANTSDIEYSNAYAIEVTSQGFILKQNATDFNNAGDTYIYMAIRRPNKPPTTGTQVYNAIARTGTAPTPATVTTGTIPDWVIIKGRSWATDGNAYTRLTGANRQLYTNLTLSEIDQGAGNGVTSFLNTGFTLGANINGENITSQTLINWAFTRAPGVFDVVCYTGTGVAKTESHGLGAVPELIIIKVRGNTYAWRVYCASLADPSRTYLVLNATDAKAGTDNNIWDQTLPTSSVFTVGTPSQVNESTTTYVAYLFATKAGISKVGSYTGNGGTADSAGSSQTINCGFTAGARFVMVKCTSHTSDWVVMDTARGIPAGNDYVLSLNTTAAEVTSTDLIDQDNSGFIINQLASGTTSANFNVTGRTYIYLAFA